MSHFAVLVALNDAFQSIEEIMKPFWKQTRDCWYQVGGDLWAYPFLVKEDYNEPFKNEFSCCSDPNSPEAPEGYKWVSAAEKGTIEWELMKQLSVNEAPEVFYKYRLIRHSLLNGCKYGFIPYGFVQDGTYYSQGDKGWWFSELGTHEKEKSEWYKKVNDYIDSLDDSQILVLLDCHV